MPGSRIFVTAFLTLFGALESGCESPWGDGSARCSGVCSADSCGDIECATEVRVHDDSSLQEALAGAKSGACIVLEEGGYGDIAVPPGVKVLSRCQASAHVGTVTFSAGEGAELCGVEVGRKGMSLLGATDVVVRSTRVTSSEDGVSLTDGATLELMTSAIVDADRYGVHGAGAVSVTMTDAEVSGSGAQGILLDCGQNDCCAPDAPRPRLTISGASVATNHFAGIMLSGADATLRDLRVTDTRPGEGSQFARGGTGLAATTCSAIEGSGLTISGNTGEGISLSSSGAVLGGSSPDEQLTIRENTIGIAIAGATDGAPVEIEGATIADNQFVGLLIVEGSIGVSVARTKITGTREYSVPAEGGAVIAVGDGILWRDESSARLDGVVLDGNERAGLLIDGPVGGGAKPSLLRDVTAAANGAVGLLQQRLPTGGAQPELDGTTLETTSSQVLSVP